MGRRGGCQRRGLGGGGPRRASRGVDRGAAAAHHERPTLDKPQEQGGRPRRHVGGALRLLRAPRARPSHQRAHPRPGVRGCLRLGPSHSPAGEKGLLFSFTRPHLFSSTAFSLRRRALPALHVALSRQLAELPLLIHTAPALSSQDLFTEDSLMAEADGYALNHAELLELSSASPAEPAGREDASSHATHHGVHHGTHHAAHHAAEPSRAPMTKVIELLKPIERLHDREGRLRREAAAAAEEAGGASHEDDSRFAVFGVKAVHTHARLPVRPTRRLTGPQLSSPRALHHPACSPTPCTHAPPLAPAHDRCLRSRGSPMAPSTFLAASSSPGGVRSRRTSAAALYTRRFSYNEGQPIRTHGGTPTTSGKRSCACRSTAGAKLPTGARGSRMSAGGGRRRASAPMRQARLPYASRRGVCRRRSKRLPR